MSNLDETIRGQQARDTRERIERDETRAIPQPSDSDPSSAADRRAAKDHAIADPADGQDAVLAANERTAGRDAGEGARRREKGPLAQEGRSRLGR